MLCLVQIEAVAIKKVCPTRIKNPFLAVVDPKVPTKLKIFGRPSFAIIAIKFTQLNLIFRRLQSVGVTLRVILQTRDCH